MLEDRFEALRRQHAEEAEGTARRVLANPRVYDLDALNGPQRAALIRFWEFWQDELATVKLLDPACGSGAFLIEAFEQLYNAYQQSNDRLEELRGHADALRPRPAHPAAQPLRRGPERGGHRDLPAQPLDQDRPAGQGAHQPRPHASASATASSPTRPSIPRAFDWQAAFPGGVRAGRLRRRRRQPALCPAGMDFALQAVLASSTSGPITAWPTSTSTSTSWACGVLKPGGRLSFVVTNKWLKAGYGEPLRRFFAENAWVESVVDFGHAKQIFEDADVFPSIIVARKPTDEPGPEHDTRLRHPAGSSFASTT